MLSLQNNNNMAAVLKPKFAKSLKSRLDALGCPYTEGADDNWIMELVFKPGEQRIRLLQWLFSKYDLRLGEMVDNPQAAVGSRMDSRIQRLLFVSSNLGLCRYDDVDVIRGVDTSASTSINKQMAFFDLLLDIVLTHDAAEDPMTKALLSPGVISDASPLYSQVEADNRYMDAIASTQLPGNMLSSKVDLIPLDIRRLMKDSGVGSPQEPASFHRLTELCNATEKSLSRRLEVLKELQEPTEQAPGQLHRASQSLDLVLGELSQLVLSFTYCYENEMLPWCDKAPPTLSQLGPAFKRVHALTERFSQMLQNLHRIHYSYEHLSKGISPKLKPDNKQLALLVDVSQAAANSFLECVSVLENCGQRDTSCLSTTSLCSSTLEL